MTKVIFIFKEILRQSSGDTIFLIKRDSINFLKVNLGSYETDLSQCYNLLTKNLLH